MSNEVYIENLDVKNNVKDMHEVGAGAWGFSKTYAVRCMMMIIILLLCWLEYRLPSKNATPFSVVPLCDMVTTSHGRWVGERFVEPSCLRSVSARQAESCFRGRAWLFFWVITLGHTRSSLLQRLHRFHSLTQNSQSTPREAEAECLRAAYAHTHGHTHGGTHGRTHGRTLGVSGHGRRTWLAVF